LGRITWQRFRHISSSLLNDLRVPAKIAQEQLGSRAKFKSNLANAQAVILAATGQRLGAASSEGAK
jgi:hypothetical protein